MRRFLGITAVSHNHLHCKSYCVCWQTVRRSQKPKGEIRPKATIRAAVVIRSLPITRRDRACRKRRSVRRPSFSLIWLRRRGSDTHIPQGLGPLHQGQPIAFLDRLGRRIALPNLEFLQAGDRPRKRGLSLGTAAGANSEKGWFHQYQARQRTGATCEGPARDVRHPAAGWSRWPACGRFRCGAEDKHLWPSGRYKRKLKASGVNSRPPALDGIWRLVGKRLRAKGNGT